MLTYQQSIHKLNIAEANYLWHCDRASTDEKVAEVLAILHKAKQTHRDLFGSLRRSDEGEWY